MFSSQGDISNFKQAEFIEENRAEIVDPKSDPFIKW
jgi:hypothetical protein